MQIVYYINVNNVRRDLHTFLPLIVPNTPQITGYLLFILPIANNANSANAKAQNKAHVSTSVARFVFYNVVFDS